VFDGAQDSLRAARQPARRNVLIGSEHINCRAVHPPGLMNVTASILEGGVRIGGQRRMSADADQASGNAAFAQGGDIGGSLIPEPLVVAEHEHLERGLECIKQKAGLWVVRIEANV